MVNMDRLKTQFRSAGWDTQRIVIDDGFIWRFTTERIQVDFTEIKGVPTRIEVWETKLHTGEVTKIADQDLDEYNKGRKEQVVFGGRTIKLTKSIDLLWDDGRRRGRIK